MRRAGPVGRPRLAALGGCLWLGLWLASAGCTEAAGDEGAICTRSTECEKGLACVEGACSADLTPLEDPSRVPMLTPPEEGEPMLDAAMMPTPAPDAGMMMPPPVAGAAGAPPPDAGAAGAAGAPPPATDAAVMMTPDAGGG